MKEKLSQKRREKVGQPTAPLKRHQVYVRVCWYVPTRWAHIDQRNLALVDSPKANAVLRWSPHSMPRSPPTNSSIIITPYTQSSLLSVIIYIQQMNAVVTGNYDMVRDPPPFFHAGFRSYGFLLEIEFNCPALLAGLNNIGRQGILAAFTSCSVSFFFA